MLCCLPNVNNNVGEPKSQNEEVGAGLAWKTKLTGLDRDCNSTVVACESFTGEILRSCAKA